MSTVMFRCPVMDRTISTHLDMTTEQYAQLSQRYVFLPCSCMVHSHRMSDVLTWLSDGVTRDSVSTAVDGDRNAA